MIFLQNQFKLLMLFLTLKCNCGAASDLNRDGCGCDYYLGETYIFWENDISPLCQEKTLRLFLTFYT